MTSLHQIWETAARKQGKELSLSGQFFLEATEIIRRCEQLSLGQPTFFPEYTDHSNCHAWEVLEGCVLLISEEAWQHVTVEDAAVLSVAVFLHDLAMHLQPTGLIWLLTNKEAPTKLRGFKRVDWRQQWDEFYRRMARMDPWQRLNIGVDHELTADPVAKMIGHAQGKDAQDKDAQDKEAKAQESEQKNSQNFGQHLTHTDRNLIGAFLRENHPRLAHEFAMKGFPQNDGPQEWPDQRDSFTDNYLELAGLIAHSHGLDLAQMPDKLGHQAGGFGFNRRAYGNVHPVYLMCLLSLSDFAQIQASRAPKRITRSVQFVSPFSRREWLVHQSIESVSLHDAPDGETLSINCNFGRPDPDLEFPTRPVDVLVKYEQWAAAFKEQLDSSWSVLSELYSNQAYLHELGRAGLRIRRLKTNKIGDADAGFVGKKITFRTQEGDLLKLLVGPLYGERPEVGLRELIANAVDAVNRRRALEQPDAQDDEPFWYLDNPSKIKTSVLDLIDNSDLKAMIEPQVDAKTDVVVFFEWRDKKTGKPVKKSRIEKWPNLTFKLRPVIAPLKLERDKYQAYVHVVDRGVGMSLATIEKQFLTAGANYAASEEFDAQGKPDRAKAAKGQRIGRFGIGALAAFLIGDDIAVKTRPRDEPESEYRFATDLSSKNIEIAPSQTPSNAFGTHIEIPVSAQALIKTAQLFEPDERTNGSNNGQSWDWYSAQYPRVLRLDMLGDEIVGKRQAPKNGWLRSNCTDQFTLEWGWDVGQNHDGTVSCNGTRIGIFPFYRSATSQMDEFLDQRTKFLDQRTNPAKELRLHAPEIRIHDPASALPISVRRYDFTETTFEWVQKLNEEIYLEALIRLFALPKPSDVGQRWFEHLGIGAKMRKGSAICCCAEAFVPIAILGSTTTETTRLFVFDDRAKAIASTNDGGWVSYREFDKQFTPSVLRFFKLESVKNSAVGSPSDPEIKALIKDHFPKLDSEQFQQILDGSKGYIYGELKQEEQKFPIGVVAKWIENFGRKPLAWDFEMRKATHKDFFDKHEARITELRKIYDDLEKPAQT